MISSNNCLTLQVALTNTAARPSFSRHRLDTLKATSSKEKLDVASFFSVMLFYDDIALLITDWGLATQPAFWIELLRFMTKLEVERAIA